MLLSPEVVRLTRPPRSAEGRADMAHTRLYSTRHTLTLEQEVRDMATAMAADTGHALSAQAIEARLAGLLEAGYPLSEEQIAAIRSAAGSGGRVAIVEGAAGSGKTTTLRPIADLYRDHGRSIVATAVAWRTAVALGNDVEARPFCVDKLLRLAARGALAIDRTYRHYRRRGRDAVDPPGPSHSPALRTPRRQDRLCRRHPAAAAGRSRTGAAPDPRRRRQRAGRPHPAPEGRPGGYPGPCPWRDAGQRHGSGPDSWAPEESGRILADYEAMADKPAFTPWQVAASTALRDGDAAAAIAAHHARGRFHIGHDEASTLTRLVDDWDHYRRTHPDRTSVVLARTRAEVRALSHLMRARRFADLPEGAPAETDRVTVTVSRGSEDERATSPLEIARGDRLRIGATHWDKQLFNGTVVTVDDLRVLGPEAGSAAGSEAASESDREPGVLITGRTDDGRRVRFRHDEIRDWYGNIRLDHGYALTITSAQGLTVDRAFLLADARPARETIYPAATRHRDRLDIYVNRAPLALDIADRRPDSDRADSDREAAVTDTEIRAWLAERWSRSQPKEAALDYMAGGEWQDRREKIGREGVRREEIGREDVRRDGSRSAAETPDGTAGVPGVSTAANDNALARIARDIRRTAFGWRHARTVAAFADGRREVLAAWDALRERTRVDGDAVALGREFGETLARHAALLKQAGTFRARPDEYAALLAECGGIGRRDLDAFEQLHARARRHRRAATMRQVHRVRREAGQTPGRRPDRCPNRRRHRGSSRRAPPQPTRPAAPKPPQTREERAAEAERDAQEFSRLQSAAYNATGEERQAAQKAFDAFRARVAEKYGTAGEKESQTRRKSKSRRMGL